MGEGVVSKGSNVVTWKKGSTYKDSSKTDQMHGSGALNSGKDYHEAGWLSLTADHEKLLGNLSIVSHMFSPLPWTKQEFNSCREVENDEGFLGKEVVALVHHSSLLMEEKIVNHDVELIA